MLSLLSTGQIENNRKTITESMKVIPCAPEANASTVDKNTLFSSFVANDVPATGYLFGCMLSRSTFVSDN